MTAAATASDNTGLEEQFQSESTQLYFYRNGSIQITLLNYKTSIDLISLGDQKAIM